MTELVDRVIVDFLHERKYPALNQTQQAGLKAGIYESSANAIVIAPTGAGKTGVADLVIRVSLASEPKRRAVYVAPLTSLVHAKYTELKKVLPTHKVMRFAEPGWQENADIMVGTNEQVYTQFLMAPATMTNFSVMVLDELHVMYDQNRGHTVEKLLTLAKIHGIRIIALSATIEDRKALAEWLEAVLVEVPESARPIPLIDHDLDGPTFNEDLVKFDKQPVLIFCATKAITESRANALTEYLESSGKATSAKAVEAAKTIQESLEVEITDRLEGLLRCLRRGVAWFHSGVPGALKGLILKAFESGGINYLFTTTALAFGFDSPTRTVVVYDLKRWDPETGGQKNIGVHEFRQMAGRAGRPTKSEFKDGYLCGVVKDASIPPELKRYRESPLEPVESLIGTVDDNFRKVILELILSGKNNAEGLVDFFQATFYGFGAEDQTVLGVFYSLKDDITSRVKSLVEDEFISPRPRGYFTLTDFGRFVAEFELDPAVSNELSVYTEVRKYLAASFDRGDELPFVPEVAHRICRILDITVPRKSGAHLDEDTVRLFSSRGWDATDGHARAAVGICYGWLEGMPARAIEDRYGVVIDGVQSAAETMGREGVPMLVGLAKLQGIVPGAVYDDLSERLKYGVTQSMLNLVRIEGIGRKRALAIVQVCDALVVNTGLSAAYRDKPPGSDMKYHGKPLGPKGENIRSSNVWEFLCRFHSTYGDEELLKLVSDAEGIGPVLSSRVLASVMHKD